MKLAVVVQRYGVDINGGAELHARYIAEHLAQHAEVRVLTTCARDYITWKNELAAGDDRVNGILVRRFAVAKPRDPRLFGQQSQLVFERPHSVADELAWLESEGPASPDLIRYLTRAEAEVDFFIFFSYRYYHSWHGIRAVPKKAVLVPTAERDAAAGVSIFKPIFRGARALMFNSFEEKALIEGISQRTGPGVVVGVGSAIPEATFPERFRRAYHVRRPFAIYVGRIDENKGCRELFDHFIRYATMNPHGLDLVLVGSKVLDVPTHPRIRHLGFLSDQDKFDAIAASDVLIMPSHYESLSMVVLEAWALGRPVLVTGHCDVLRGQVIRSNGGLYYESFEEFVEALYALEAAGPVGGPFGANGRDFYRRHYSWPVIERKYLDMFDRLARESGPQPLDPVPGLLARRRRDRQAAADVVRAVKTGPAVH